MSRLGMMEESKGMPLLHAEDEPQEEVVEEEYILDNGMMTDEITMGYAEEEEVLCEDEHGYQYGGMEHDLYDAIVEYKNSGRYPDMADQRVDRSAHCHWRLRCARFKMHEDEMTLLYGGENSHIENPKFVIKKGEVKEMIHRVHSLIGHVGTKRTQAALQKKMYWRSVRNDVIEFVKTCEFCADKKMQGKKLAKAPIDIASEAFDLEINVEYTQIPNQRIIRVNLSGCDEEYIRAASMQRMTSYTFRTTEAEHRKSYRTPPFFKRQPYMRRPRYEHPSAHSGFLVPVMNRMTREPHYMALNVSRVDEMSRLHADKREYMDDIEDDELTPIDPTVASGSRAASAASGGNEQQQQHAGAADAAAAAQPRPRSAAAAAAHRRAGLRQAKVYDTNHPAYRRANAERAIKEGRQPKRDEHRSIRGAASRYSSMMAQNSMRADGQSSSTTAAVAAAVERHIMYNQNHGLVGHEMITPFEEARDRPEFAPLAPVLLMPSNDPEVAELQKELLNRQLEIQKMQMRVLQAHEHRMNIEGARFDETDGREDVEELNVIDTDGY